MDPQLRKKGGKKNSNLSLNFFGIFRDSILDESSQHFTAPFARSSVISELDCFKFEVTNLIGSLIPIPPIFCSNDNAFGSWNEVDFLTLGWVQKKEKTDETHRCDLVVFFSIGVLPIR